MLEKTSGSSTAAKYIPYTSSLRREFQRGVGLGYLISMRTIPSWFTERLLAITPMAREPEVTAGGLRVGFENDTEYLGAAERFLLARSWLCRKKWRAFLSLTPLSM